MRSFRLVDALYPTVTFAVLLVAWELGVKLADIPVYYVPAPSDVLAALYNGFDIYLRNLSVTLFCTITAFLIALVSGVVLGALVGEFRVLERTLLPVMVALQAMPRIALAPMILVWFGFGPSSKIVLGAFTAFFPIFLNASHGMLTADADQIALMRSIRATKLQIFWKIKLPTAIPFLLAGANVGLIFAMLAVIVGEFVGSNVGMGFLIQAQSAQMDAAAVFAGVFILSAVGVLFHQGLQWLRGRLLFWSLGNEAGGASAV